MLNTTSSKILTLAIAATTMVACGKRQQTKSESSKKPDAMVTNVETTPVDLPVAADPTTAKTFKKADEKAKALQSTEATAAQSATVTFRKDKIFDREFLYGFDLQFSSGADAQYDLIPQTEALGHVPASFRRVGNDLQLVADQSRLYESVVNHPEVLLATYSVVSETSETLTVKVGATGLTVNQVYNGKDSDLPKQIWVRSFQYVEQGDYLLQEIGLLLKNGTVQTFMEAVFPRASLVPAGYKGLEGNADFEPLASRYRFITGENVWVNKVDNGETSRVQTSFASRFHLGETGTIDWYVTPNIPDQFIPVIKSGVEGWNRYFEPQLGRKVVRFLGKLPEGVKIGDPRYNVINFDSVAEAGAAYESQAIDPMSGIQSHSLVYMPYAWYNIGVALWSTRTDTFRPSEDRLSAILSPKGTEVLFAKNRKIMSCMKAADDVSAPAALLAEAMLAPGNVPTPKSLDEFGKRLMIATLFHEIGHALGLDHNFKGSLAFDGTKPAGEDNPTSWSVMDYNYYQNEMDLVEEIGGIAGPALEYDRQIISQLYGAGKHVGANDLVVPACNDQETDDVAGGQDPFCVRYDAESDPSRGVVHSFHNLTAATGAAGIEAKTLAEMIADLNVAYGEKFASATDVPDVSTMTTLATELGSKVGTLSGYFIASGAQSLRVNLRNNARTLRTFKDGTATDELAFRSRYLMAFNAGIAFRELPEAPKAALASLLDAVKAGVARNPVLADTDGAQALKAATLFETAAKAKVEASLSRVRNDAYANLGLDLTMPFALQMTPGGELSHFEDIAVNALVIGATIGLDGAKISQFARERETAVTSLASFRGASPKVEEVAAALQALITQGLLAGNTELVTTARSLLKILNG